MTDDTLPDEPWDATPWTKAHRETLEEAWKLASRHGNRPVYEAIDAALAEIDRLERALNAVVMIARALQPRERS